MRELNTDAYFAAMKQPKRAILDYQKSVHDGVKYPCKLCRYQATQRDILKNTKSLRMMESSTLANFAAIKQLQTGILKDTKSLCMIESNTLAHIAQPKR